MTEQPPAPVAYVRDLLAGFPGTWILCGGWAADAWLGQPTRDHYDVDIMVFHDEQRAVFEHLAGWSLVGHDPNVPDDTAEQWNGRLLDLPAHIHVPMLGTPLAGPETLRHPEYEFEFLLNERADGRWIANREQRVTVPPERTVMRHAWDVPTAAPEVVLFCKAGGNWTPAEISAWNGTHRERDEADFFKVLPTLEEPQRIWLRDSLSAVIPHHPWLAHLR